MGFQTVNENFQFIDLVIRDIPHETTQNKAKVSVFLKKLQNGHNLNGSPT